MIINHNMASLNTYRQLSANNANSSKSLEKLSSGLRINKAGDDAAGLAISEKMRSQIRGLDQAGRNAQDGISLIQTAEGSLNEVHSILQRMKELSTQSASDTNVTVDRAAIQDEMNQLTSEVNRIGNTSSFNTRKLLDGSIHGTGSGGTAGVTTLQIGTEFVNGDTLNIDGVVFTNKTTADETKNEFAVGADADAQATSLAAAIQNSSLKDKYTVTVSADTLTLTQKPGYFSATDLTATATGSGVTTLTETTNGAAGTSGKLTLQIGATGGESFVVDVNDMRANSSLLKIASNLGATDTTSTGKTITYTTATSVTDGTSDTGSMHALDVSTSTNASAAMDAIDDAIKNVSTERAKLGAYTNRLEHTITNLGTASENLTAAESRVRDVDMAKEMMNFQKNNILSQAAQAMLAQANQQPQGVLQLLR